MNSTDDENLVSPLTHINLPFPHLKYDLSKKWNLEDGIRNN
jgi:hypothetical protein